MHLRVRPPSRRGVYGAMASVAAVAVVTGAIELLKAHIPVLSLGVLYIAAVLPVAIAWGLGFAVAVAIGSMLAFNFFFLPPLYAPTLADSRNWFALAVFVVTAVVVSELAARSRRQARESALLARIATSLLAHGSVSAELERIAAEAAQALQVERARIELGDDEAPRHDDESYPLAAADRQVGTIYLEGARERTARARHLVHVRETDVVGDEAIELESRSEAQQLLVPRLEELRSLGVDAEGEIIASVGRHTDVARQILERARTRGVELIVLGPPRQHGVTETLLSDVTAEIVRHAPCDVLIVTPRPASVVA